MPSPRKETQPTPAQRILVVEDEPAIADTICDALQTEGFVLSHYTHLQDAASKLDRENLALVILDIVPHHGMGYALKLPS